MEGNIVAIDCETTGLDPYHGHRVFCFGYMTEKGEYGFFTKSKASIAWLERLLNDSTKTIIFHNAKFDLKMLLFEGIDIFKIRADIHCTLVLAKLYSIIGKYDLKSLAVRYCERTTEDKDEVTTWIKSNTRVFLREKGRRPTFKDAPIEIVKKRCLWDVESTILLFHALKNKVIKDAQLASLYDRERQIMFISIGMENRGVKIDIEKAKELRNNAACGVKTIQKWLNQIVCPLAIEGKEPVTELKASSSIQLPAAFRKLGISLKYRTQAKKGKGGGRWSFDYYSMSRYVPQSVTKLMRTASEESWEIERFLCELVEYMKEHHLKRKDIFPALVLKLREQTKLISTYYNHFIDEAVPLKNDHNYGILHGTFNPSEAMTGRFSASKPNLQNLPRLTGPRECFIARTNRTNYYFDYEQVEMRMFVHFAKDEQMAEAIKKDIHTHVAAQIYHCTESEVKKEWRTRAKQISFGVLYGAGPDRIAEALTKNGLPTTRLEAEDLFVTYHRSFPSVRKLTNRLKLMILRNGYITNPFGRRYHIPSQFAYKALNYMCQGTAADLMKDAMVRIWTMIEQNKLQSRIIQTVHDELVIEIPREEEYFVTTFKELMEDKSNYFVPITVSVARSVHRWSDKTTIEVV